jgi:CarD family transcriptional regulator
MPKIGEKVVYGSYGVMEIVDIREETFMNATQSYYVLLPGGAQAGSMTYIPVNNAQLVAKMKPLLSEEEIYSIIKNLDSIPIAEWIPDNRARSESFKATVEEGDRVKMISMIKLIKKTGERRAAEGKKNFLADESIMQKAEKLLYSELATVFGIDESSVADFILENK